MLRVKPLWAKTLFNCRPISCNFCTSGIQLAKNSQRKKSLQNKNLNPSVSINSSNTASASATIQAATLPDGNKNSNTTIVSQNSSSVQAGQTKETENIQRNIIKPGTPVGSLTPGFEVFNRNSKSFKENLHLKKFGPKLFEATAELIPEKRALYMPRLQCKSLLGNQQEISLFLKGKISLVVFEFAKFAEPHAKSYIEPFESIFKENPKVNLVQLNIEENMLKAFILKTFLGYIRATIPKYRQNSYFTHFGSINTIKQQLGIANKFLGYCFLVDKNTKIRWYANGLATKQEQETLIKLTHSLLKS
ncbi:hypothetical protein BB560_002621 [Smittium megazygosporum]|uniref:Uncharacterized protein n=1 Tax=Smittium megazygosporum TaxID=133381 RepID=A0A2T9ZED9_9FUNG|nr:hypothetical protein BB560_002621 [Smittium megazygosporum]